MLARGEQSWGLDFMVTSVTLGHDALRLMVVALSKVGPNDPKACRRFRRDAVVLLQVSPAQAEVKAEAIRGFGRACGDCAARRAGRCKGTIRAI